MYAAAKVPEREVDLFGGKIEESTPQMVIFEYGMTVEDWEKLATDFASTDIDFLDFRFVDTPKKKTAVEGFFKDFANWYELYKAEKGKINPNSSKEMMKFKRDKAIELKKIIDAISAISNP